MKFDVKQAIVDRLRETNRENIEKVIDFMERNRFFKYHCYRHHHYEGGLADHAWQTFQIAMRVEAERCAKNPNATRLEADSIAIASLLHDLCNCSGMREIHGHGRRSAKIIKELGFRLTQDEFLAIRFHMNLKDKTTHPLYKEAFNSPLRKLVHTSDGKSAKLHYGHDDMQK